MGLIKGGFLRLFQTFLYLLAFCCAGVTIGVYSYFLAVLADRNEPIAKWKRAVEGISGAAVVYTIFAVLLTCCLGGVGFFAFLAIVLDILFAGGMIANAVLTRSGADSCHGRVYTPIGNGNAGSKQGFSNGRGQSEVTYSVTLGTACRLNTAAFAVSIIGAVIFIICALFQIALVRSHRKEKRFGPSPANNYTSGYGKRNFWTRKGPNGTARDAEVGAGGLAAPGPDMRPSHETGYTGSTVGGTGLVQDKTEAGNTGFATHGTHTGYYNQAQGQGVNPYTNTTTATNY